MSDLVSGLTAWVNNKTSESHPTERVGWDSGDDYLIREAISELQRQIALVKAKNAQISELTDALLEMKATRDA